MEEVLGMNDKTILVIMPVYNTAKFLQGAVESVLQQTYQNFKLVIVNDCSTDNSLEVLKQYQDHPKVSVISNAKNRGCYFSRNKALEFTEGKEWEFFTTHDSDDLSDINRFTQILKHFEEPSILGVKPTYIAVDPELKPKRVHAGEGQSFFRRVVFDEILGYYDNTNFSGDTDYWWRLEAYCETNPKFSTYVSTEQLYLRVEHGNNLTTLIPTKDRLPYFYKKKSEILEMKKSNSFYRPYLK